MSTLELNNFTDFDRLLLSKNLIVTILGTALAFSISFLQLYIPIPYIQTMIPIPFPAFYLSMAIAVMIIVTVLTKNIASTVLVALVGSIGLVPVTNDYTFISGYILVNLISLLILGILADRLQLIMDWVTFNLRFATIFSIITISIGIFFNPHANKYWSNGITLGNGGDLQTNLGLPILDGIILGILLFVLLIFYLILRGQILLTASAAKNYRIFGYLLLVIGQLLVLIPLFAFFQSINYSTLSSIAFEEGHLSILDNLFLHQGQGPYFVFGNPFNIFFVIAANVTLSLTGVSLLMIAREEGNLEGVKGESDVIFLFPAIAFLLYFILGNYYLIQFIPYSGFFISIELYTVFAAVIYTVYYSNTLVARIILGIKELIID